MTNPSNRYENLTPTRHEKAAEVTDTEVNEELERGATWTARISSGRRSSTTRARVRNQTATTPRSHRHRRATTTDQT